jgi:hypothetical protein
MNPADSPRPVADVQQLLRTLPEGWRIASETTRAHCGSAALFEKTMGEPPQCARYEMTIVAAQPPLAGFHPVHGDVQHPPLATARDAALWLEQYYTNLPEEQKLTSAAYEALYTTPGARWVRRDEPNEGVIVREVEHEGAGGRMRLTVQPFTAFDQYAYIAVHGRAPERFTVGLDELRQTHAPLPAPPEVPGFGDGDCTRQLLYGRIDPHLGGGLFVVVYSGQAGGIPVYKQTGIDLDRIELDLGTAVREAIAADRGVPMLEAPFDNYRELRLRGLIFEEVERPACTLR